MKKLTLLFLTMFLAAGVSFAQQAYYLSWEVGVTAGSAAFKTENYSVLVSTTGTDPADFTEVFTETMPDDTPNWEPQHREVELDVVDYQGENIHVAFRHHDSEDHDRLIIFSVRVYGVYDEGEYAFLDEDFYGGKPDGEEDVDPDWLPDGWLAIDADGDGYNWYYSFYEDDDEGYMLSQSSYYDEENEEWVALDPDNWLITSSVAIEDPTPVATLAELRTMPEDGTVYVYTGEAVLTAMKDFRNQKFIQDGTAAITIDDNPGIITTEYELYDVITNVFGKIDDYYDYIRFQPVENTAPAEDNTPIEPEVFALDGLVHPDDQSKLVKFENVSFVGIEDGDVFENGTNYTITDGTNEFPLRTDFWHIDYIGWEIPHGEIDISGVIIYDWGELKIVPRFSYDLDMDALVTFNVDMTDAVAEGDVVFDPDIHDVYITGTVARVWDEDAGEWTDWPQPGSDDSFMMEDIGDNIYTITLEVEDGEHQYKYFLVDDEPTWEIGEWPGDPNREIVVDASMTMNDVFGAYYPYIDPVDAEFDIRNPADVETTIAWGEATEILEITLDGDPVDAAHFTVDDVTLTFDEALFDGAEHDDTFVFTIEFDFGDDVTFTVNVIDSELRIEEIDGFTVSVFPNPANDKFTLEANEVITQIKLFNINGQIVKDFAVNDLRTEVEVNNLRPGVYLLQIHTENSVITERVQVSR